MILQSFAWLQHANARELKANEKSTCINNEPDHHGEKSIDSFTFRSYGAYVVRRLRHTENEIRNSYLDSLGVYCMVLFSEYRTANLRRHKFNGWIRELSQSLMIHAYLELIIAMNVIWVEINTLTKIKLGLIAVASTINNKTELVLTFLRLNQDVFFRKKILKIVCVSGKDGHKWSICRQCVGLVQF